MKLVRKRDKRGRKRDIRGRKRDEKEKDKEEMIHWKGLKAEEKKVFSSRKLDQVLNKLSTTILILLNVNLSHYICKMHINNISWFMWVNSRII